MEDVALHLFKEKYNRLVFTWTRYVIRGIDQTVVQNQTSQVKSIVHPRELHLQSKIFEVRRFDFGSIGGREMYKDIPSEEALLEEVILNLLYVFQTSVFLNPPGLLVGDWSDLKLKEAQISQAYQVDQRDTKVVHDRSV